MRGLLCAVLLASFPGSSGANARARTAPVSRAGGAAPLLALPLPLTRLNAAPAPGLPKTDVDGITPVPRAAPESGVPSLPAPAAADAGAPALFPTPDARPSPSAAPEAARAPGPAEAAAPEAAPKEAPTAREQLDALDGAVGQAEPDGDAADLKLSTERVFDGVLPRPRQVPAVDRGAVAARIGSLEARLGPAPKEPYRAPARLAVPMALARAGSAASEAVGTVFSANLLTLAFSIGVMVAGAIFLSLARRGEPGLFRMIVVGGSRVAPETVLENRGLFELLTKRARLPKKIPLAATIDDRSGEMNAYFAEMPGGPALISLGSKMAAIDLEPRAGIVAHEIGHFALDRKRGLAGAARAASIAETLLKLVARVCSVAVALLLSLLATGMLLGEIPLSAGDFFLINAVAFSVFLGFTLISAALSLWRRRLAEYRADDYAAWLTDASWLVRALEKIDPRRADTNAEPSGLAARLLAKVFWRSLSTHPSTAERIRRLKARKA